MQTKLTADQLTANRKAIHSYIIAQTKANGGLSKSPVILVPEFFEDSNGEWLPKQSNGVRATSKEGLAYMRLGMSFLRDNLTAGFLLTNSFADEAQLAEGLELMGVSIGDMIPGKKLVVRESLTPFNSKDPDRDLKAAGTTGIFCTLDDQPIYRVVKLENKHIKDSEGNVVENCDRCIAHNNNEAIRKQWNLQNATGQGLTVAQKAARLQELKAIPANKRTPEQKLELAELS